MEREILSWDKDGKPNGWAFRESTAERIERQDRAAREAMANLHFTPGMLKTLAQVRNEPKLRLIARIEISWLKRRITSRDRRIACLENRVAELESGERPL